MKVFAHRRIMSVEDVLTILGDRPISELHNSSEVRVVMQTTLNSYRDVLDIKYPVVSFTKSVTGTQLLLTIGNLPNAILASKCLSMYISVYSDDIDRLSMKSSLSKRLFRLLSGIREIKPIPAFAMASTSGLLLYLLFLIGSGYAVSWNTTILDLFK